MRVLIAGAAGMLGQDVVGAARRRGHDVSAMTRQDLDITDPASIDRAIAEFRPEAVIDCAAWSDVDGAEDDERGAMAINDTGAALLAAGAARVGASVLYPSSDYVFDGTGRRALPRGRHARPGQRLRPLEARRRGLGGGSQPAALHRPHARGCSGSAAGNFVETMLRIGGEQPEVLVVSDQRGCPTSCADLAEGMVRLIGTDRYGIHHMVGAGTSAPGSTSPSRSSTRPTWRRG